MLRSAWLIARKDLKLAAGGGQGLAQTMLLGLLIIFVFSLSRPAGEPTPPQAAAAVFWLATAFGLVLVFNLLYSLEEAGGARLGLLLSPAPVQAVWLGKALAGLALLLLAQALFLPAVVAFLGQDLGAPAEVAWPCLGAALAVDWGLVAVGSMLGALAQGQAARESLLSVALFPLLIPALLAGVRAGAALFGAAAGAPEPLDPAWLTLALAFGALYSGAALILFPFVYSGEE